MVSIGPGSEAFYTCDSNKQKRISISGLTGKNHKATRRGSKKVNLFEDADQQNGAI
jgi:hypothetical protein